MHRAAAMLAVAVLSLPLLGGCDVTNPGPVQDEFLVDPQAQPGLVTGAERSITELVAPATYTMSQLAREIFPGGQTGAWGHNVTVQGGHVQPGSFGGYWNDAQQARFIAETAIKRFSEVDAADEVMYGSHLWAGYAYRLLGSWWCDAVVASTDPDDVEPGVFEEGTDTYFERAVDNFTAALEFARTDRERHAALAGRAQAHVWLGNWGNAAADAGEVPDDFVFAAEMSGSETPLYNDFHEATSGQFRSYSVTFTFFEDYYEETGDPRTPWIEDPEFETATASLQGFGKVPYLRQRKHTSRNDDINLASGWEMRLVEAEADLVAGNWETAMDRINRVRTRNVSDVTGDPLEPWEATSLDEAWTFLKRERYIELWLEGRRLPDVRRWMADERPGSLDWPEWEDPSHPGHTPLFTENPQSYCFDIPDSERDLNPNVPVTGG